MINKFFVYCALLCFVSINSYAGAGKLLGTAGLMQVEGSGGGGLVPWATLAGYDGRDEISLNAAATFVQLQDYKLASVAGSVSLYDTVELSIAKQTFELSTLGGSISQNIFGLKYRLFGDVVYEYLPQVSIGLQHKRLQDGAVANALGAQNSHYGTDFYIASTKVHLAAIAGYNAVWNITLRSTKANEMGLLGFGKGISSERKTVIEGSAGVLFSRHVAVGVEYRQKPDFLGLGEDDWTDFFISYFPNKKINITLAWAELGRIAGSEPQSGLYLSINGQL